MSRSQQFQYDLATNELIDRGRDGDRRLVAHKRITMTMTPDRQTIQI